MSKTSPQITAVSGRMYYCADLPALHSWLLAQGYTYYGPVEPDEYGRFSHQAAYQQGEQHFYEHAYIQVKHNGDIYAPDPQANALLCSLVEAANQERAL